MLIKKCLLMTLILITILLAIGCDSTVNEDNLEENFINQDGELKNFKDIKSDNTKYNNQIEIESPDNYKPMKIKNYKVSDNLQKIDFDVLVGQGIPSIILKGPEEYKNKNPWVNNKEIKVLPVFKNNNYNIRFHEGPLEHLTKDESIEVGLLIAEKLGIDTTKYETAEYGKGYNVCFPNKKETIVEIEPSIEGVRIFFVSFNDSKNTSLPDIDESKEEVLHEKYLVYYYNVYKNILKMEQPVFESCFVSVKPSPHFNQSYSMR